MSFSVVDIMNQKARQAWELYLRMETSSDSFSILQLIANDCYKVIQCLNVSLLKTARCNSNETLLKYSYL